MTTATSVTRTAAPIPITIPRREPGDPGAREDAFAWRVPTIAS
jgi:hypothetical protein